MRRQEFIGFSASTATAWPLAARAQQGGEYHTVGCMSADSAIDPPADEFTDALRLGWIEDKASPSSAAIWGSEWLPELATT